MNVQLPDGTIIEGVPEGTTRAEIEKKYRAHIGTPAPVVSPYEATAQEDSNASNLLAAIGGAMKAPYVGLRQAMGAGTPQDVKEWKDSMAGLWSTPMGKVGTVVGGAATAAPIAMVPGANTAAGAALTGAAYGASQPVTGSETRLANTVEGMGGGVAGKYLGDALGKGASALFNRSATNAASAQSTNAVRDATLREAQAAGYVFPPNQVAPNVVNRALEGVSGKISTAQGAAVRNEGVNLSLAKKAIGLPDDVPLNKDTLSQVRSIAGEAYKSLKQIGPVANDADLARAMQGVTGEYRALIQDFPSQRNAAIDTLISDLEKPQFNSASLVELVKRLRSDARANLKAFDDPAKKALGQVQMGAQNAIEDLFDRTLQASGNGDFLQVFRNARTTIAKTHTIENALEESTGKIVASKIGKEYAKGKPLTGELATIGKTAQAFPKAVQNLNTGTPGVSPLDWMAGILSGNPVVPFARPAVRAGILSGPYQRAMVHPPSYEVSAAAKHASGLLDTEATRKLLQSLGMSIPSEQ